MRLASVRIGDVVLVNHRGRRFHAEVTDRLQGGLAIRPIDSRFTWRTCTAREVERVWYASRQAVGASS
jgi:hypothetical protein